MPPISLRPIEASPLAIARREVHRSEIGAVMVSSLDAVWAFVRARGLEGGHNVAVYGPGVDDELRAWFGVEVGAPFDGDCSIEYQPMPAGLTAVATHVGPYHRLADTHRAVVAWCEAEGHALSGTSWERYGDWRDDPDQLETEVGHLLA